MGTPVKIAFQTTLGRLYHGDCLSVLRAMEPGTVDTIFADPPFNIGKEYGPRVNDKMSESAYLAWCHSWLALCERALKPGGAMFVYNLPKRNMLLGAHLSEMGMLFRHWIAIEHKSSLPISGKLYPAHYSLLYFTKGKPKTFRKLRTPIELCRHCRGEIKDYGGHRAAMNAAGVNLKDIWTDIPPVRHKKFKPSTRSANALSTKLLDRVVEMTTCEGDLVLDPFGGSGTTYAVCEKKGRRWIGAEIEDVSSIIERLSGGAVGHHRNDDAVECAACQST